MGGPTTITKSPSDSKRTSESSSPSNTSSIAVAQIQSGNEKLPPHSISVNNISNKREDLPYYILPANKGVDFDMSKPPILVVNGMNMISDSIFSMGQSIANKFDRGVLMIPNTTEGMVKDIRNCIASAFSSKLGVHLENGAAGHLAANLVNRLNDDKPIDLIAYSQGTLITSNVLQELRTFLIQSDKKDVWDSFADRIHLKTYGAATHVWPEGLREIKEYRHIGDPVAAICNSVTAIQMIGKVSVGDFQGEFSTQVKLNVFKDAHSIKNYLGTSNFYLKELKGLDAQTQSTKIMDSINRNEFSTTEYNQIIQCLALKGIDVNGKISEINHSIQLSQKLVEGFNQNRKAALILSTETIECLTNTAAQGIKEKTPLLKALLPGNKYR